MFSRQIPKGLSHIGNAVWTKTGSLTRSSHQFKKLSAVDSEKIRDRIATIVGDSNVSVANIVRSQHGQDEGPDQGMIPDVVAFPGETAEVSEICKICYEDSLPIIPFGTGTGLEAGISALHGGVCVDLSRMSQVLDYHPEDFDVVVEPGVTREDLNHHVKDDGLWFPVDPGANASVCGMCATGASGTNAVRYGTIKENCLNLEVVLPDGEILHTAGRYGQRPKKTSAGYNLTNLFVGSEGTLGIITKATMKLHALPEAVVAAVVSFPDVQSAVDTVVNIQQCGLPMARMELLDTMAIKVGERGAFKDATLFKACNGYSSLSLKEQPTLFLEFHSTESGLEEQTSIVAELAKANGGSAFDYATKQEDRNKLWTARHKLFYASLNLIPGSKSVTTDVCVPISKLPEIVDQTSEDIVKTGVTGPLLGHVGDGNFHCLLLFRPDHPEEYTACKGIANRLAIRAIEMGGTCTGEHGVGTGKIGLLQEQFGPVGIDAMKRVKMAFDPKGIMNPGKVVPL